MLRTGWVLTTVPWCTCQKTSGSRRACKSFSGVDSNASLSAVATATSLWSAFRQQISSAVIRRRSRPCGTVNQRTARRPATARGEAGLTTALQGWPAARRCGASGAGWPRQPRCVQRLDEVVNPARPDQAFDRLRKRFRACAAQRRAKRDGRRAPPRIPASRARRAPVPRRLRPPAADSVQRAARVTCGTERLRSAARSATRSAGPSGNPNRRTAITQVLRRLGSWAVGRDGFRVALRSSAQWPWNGTPQSRCLRRKPTLRQDVADAATQRRCGQARSQEQGRGRFGHRCDGDRSRGEETRAILAVHASGAADKVAGIGRRTFGREAVAGGMPAEVR